jgi:arylsulfatase A-like enzyme
LFLSRLYEKYKERKLASYKERYPNGLPNTNGGNYYALEEGIDWLMDEITEFPQPFFAYVHYHPPHFPYKPRIEFNNIFVNDLWKPLNKPDDLFTEENSYETLAKARAYYDESILNVDSEFGRLFDRLESSGILENTWVVLTSDHGEMQERGISGHVTPTLYQPIVRVPLMIFEPGQLTGREVHTPTSAVDLMTTLLHVTGHDIPAWSEGSILPPYAPPSDSEVFTVQARRNNVELPLTEATIMQVSGKYKLIYYLGYEQIGGAGERWQLFDIEADPEELNDISTTKKDTASELLEKLKFKLKEVNKPFQGG